jgi:hypothetical protein
MFQPHTNQLVIWFVYVCVNNWLVCHCHSPHPKTLTRPSTPNELKNVPQLSFLLFTLSDSHLSLLRSVGCVTYSLLKTFPKVAKKMKGYKWWQICYAYLKIWCKLGCTRRIKRRNPSGRGGGKNTIVINIQKRKKDKKQGWKILCAMQPTHNRIMEWGGRGFTIICL